IIMRVEQIYTGCLAQSAYYITSNGEAAIIDPLKEIKPYTDKLKKDGVELKYIFETNFHADYIGGHFELARNTGAAIVFGPGADPKFKFISARDNEEFQVGGITIKALHIPWHTMESITYLLIDESGKDYCIFSGDNLFSGNVQRIIPAQSATYITQHELADLLYEKIIKNIMPLADDVIVYPTHGTGSACGKNMMKEAVDTIGNQKRINYMLKQPNKEAFTKAVIGGSIASAYSGMHETKYSGESLDLVLNNGLRALSADSFEIAAWETEALILDTRENAVFYRGYIPQSVNVGLDGEFAPWLCTLVEDLNQPILVVADENKEEESIIRLNHAGFYNILGHLKNGFASWLASGKKVDFVDRITAAQFANELEIEKDIVIDIRKETEYLAGHVEKAYNRPLDAINEWIKYINPAEHFFIHSAGGYRSMIAASILQARGYRNFTEVEGGFKAIGKMAIPRLILSK
ncbi:MAG: MBL fold metallo-hydrolase, partial [Flavisolibacter sp.]